MSVNAWIALGSNLGDRAGHLTFARTSLAGTPGIDAIAAGSVDETPPLGGLDQPPYLNQMLRVTTSLEPRFLLHVCHEIEKRAGRVRETRWCSRTLDLDLVRFGHTMCDLPELTLPHPGLRDRTFWARQIAALETHD
jgi:2-amino-4-hydroxy-6-hydroxymethyldihydropteridine diphosphokinase